MTAHNSNTSLWQSWLIILLKTLVRFAAAAAKETVQRLISTLPSHDDPVVSDILAYLTPGAATVVQQEYAQMLTGQYTVQPHTYQGMNRSRRSVAAYWYHMLQLWANNVHCVSGYKLVGLCKPVRAKLPHCTTGITYASCGGAARG
jgi:hypothetical protein